MKFTYARASAATVLKDGTVKVLYKDRDVLKPKSKGTAKKPRKGRKSA